MALPWILYLGSGAQTLPLLAALRYGRRLPPARRWMVVWGLTLVVGDVIELGFALRGRHNLGLRYLFGPLEVVTLLAALSLWQRNFLARLTLRFAIPMFVLGWGLLILFVEDTEAFSLVTGPLQSLLLLIASLGTLLLLIRHEEGSLLARDWFWICLGLSITYGSEVALNPLSRLLVVSHPAVVSSAYKLKSLVDVLAFVAIARGMLCPILLPPSTGPSSPASSPSPSFSPRSAPPW